MKTESKYEVGKYAHITLDSKGRTLVLTSYRQGLLCYKDYMLMTYVDAKTITPLRKMIVFWEAMYKNDHVDKIIMHDPHNYHNSVSFQNYHKRAKYVYTDLDTNIEIEFYTMETDDWDKVSKITVTAGKYSFTAYEDAKTITAIYYAIATAMSIVRMESREREISSENLFMSVSGRYKRTGQIYAIGEGVFVNVNFTYGCVSICTNNANIAQTYDQSLFYVTKNQFRVLKKCLKFLENIHYGRKRKSAKIVYDGWHTESCYTETVESNGSDIMHSVWIRVLIPNNHVDDTPYCKHAPACLAMSSTVYDAKPIEAEYQDIDLAYDFIVLASTIMKHEGIQLSNNTERIAERVNKIESE
jgi:hypothetical protein